MLVEHFQKLGASQERNKFFSLFTNSKIPAFDIVRKIRKKALRNKKKQQKNGPKKGRTKYLFDVEKRINDARESLQIFQ